MSEQPQDEALLVGNFVKLYGSIVTSSVWGESAPTRIVWLTMLAIADANGGVAGSVPGLARIANVTVKECEEALAVLSAPDKYSRTEDHDGRRIKTVNGGWMVLNYKLYRELRTPKQVKEAERKADYRERQREEQDTTGQSRMSRAEVEVEVEVETTNSPPRAGELFAGMREWPEPVENFLRSLKARTTWAAEFAMWLDGGREFPVTMDDIAAAVNDYVGNSERPNLMSVRAYIRRAFKARKLREMEGAAGGETVVAGMRTRLHPEDRAIVEASEYLQSLVEKRDPLHPHTLTQEGWALVSDKQRAALKAIGGVARVLNSKPEHWTFTVKDFLTALRGAK